MVINSDTPVCTYLVNKLRIYSYLLPLQFCVTEASVLFQYKVTNITLFSYISYFSMTREGPRSLPLKFLFFKLWIFLSVENSRRYFSGEGT